MIGRDTRESGPHIAECIARGLAAAGRRPCPRACSPHPGVAWLVNREGFSAGVVISASHNPYHDNGVKLISSSGMKFPDAVEARSKQSILSKNGASFGHAQANAAQRTTNRCTRITWRACGRPFFPARKLAGMKIVLDCANGAASKLAPELFRSLGAERHRAERPAGRAQHQCRLRFAASGRAAEAGGRHGRGAGRGV